MRLSKTIMNFLLIVLAFLIMSSITGIVVAKQNAEKMIRLEVKDEIKYELPFPGLLPDHPLYKLKMARDKLWEFLISDLERRAYFEILMADKRMSAGRMLIEDKGKIDLGLSTIGKGYKYLEKTPAVIKALREQNFNINNLIDKLEKSAIKHISLLEKFSKRADINRQQKKEINNLLKMYRDFLPKVRALR